MKSRRENNNENDEIARREQELWDKARPRYDAIMERHLRLPTVDDDGDGDADADANSDATRTATTTTSNSETNESTKEQRELQVRRKRLVYRSKQRGWLEVDLLLGTWAAENVPSLTVDELDEFENFVNMETIDIYNVLTLRVDVPEEMRGSMDEKSLVERIQDWAKESPLGKADRERYVEVKTKNNLI